MTAAITGCKSFGKVHHAIDNNQNEYKKDPKDKLCKTVYVLTIYLSPNL